ncbi:hypothetical protein JCM6882_007340 [Rhodosporidiobolus microsporus]
MAAPVGALVPRVFQMQALEQALERNVVVRADTGAGKTLIAVMVLRQMAALEANEGQLAVFLTPTVSLVHQQAGVLRDQTLLKVKEFVGADGVDFWKRDKWQEQLRQADAIVLTPQIFLDVLSKAYWSMDKVSLIVFYHPRKAAGQPVPRILGLTASPIFNVKNPEKAIRDFETLLDARILEIAKEHKVEVRSHAPRATEQLVEHAPEPCIVAPQLDSLVVELRRHVKLEEAWVDRLQAARTLFGPAGVEILVAHLAREYRASPTFIAKLEARNSSPVLPSGLSTKMQKLVEVLIANKDDDFHAIVFCQMRHHAVVLSALLQRIPSLSSWIKSKPLVGHGGRGRPGASQDDAARDTGMLAKEQLAIVSAFRSGELNLIVATRVAEEGLDFRRCNLVVRFDALTTITGYIQSRSRARAASARFVVLAEFGSPEAAKYLQYVKEEQAMVEMYAERPLEDNEEREAELDNLPTYTTSTSALLTHQNAIPTLAQFCQLLVKPDAFTPLQNPHYALVTAGAGLWRSELKLPRIKALDRSTYRSEAMATKKAAKQNAAFQVCIDLHRAGGLDDFLMPFREPLEGFGAKDADGREVDRTVAPKSVDVVFPNVFGNAWTQPSMYLHVVQLTTASSTSRLGLVCASSSPSSVHGALYARNGHQITVSVVDSSEVPWQDDAERKRRLDELDVFNRNCTRIVLNRRIGDDRSFALWTPVTSDGKVDWAAVESAFEPFEAEKVKPGELVVVPFRRPSKRIGTFVTIRDDVDSSSPTLEVEVDPPRKKLKMMDRYSSYWLYSKVCYDLRDIGPDSNEPIVEMNPLDLEPYNALVPPQPDFSQLPHSSRHFRTFPSSMVQKTTLALDFWKAFTLVPSLDFLIVSQLHAASAINKFKFPPIQRDRLVEALTAPQCQAGRDLEFLETVGDSALKLATSVHIFLEYPTAEEERLTRVRMNSVDNRFLRQRSRETGYSSFIIPHLLRTTTFLPFTADDATLSADGLSLTKKIPRLLLCDSVEATLGAAVVTGGLDMAIAAGDKLGLCFGGVTPWAKRASAKPLLEVEPAKAGVGFREVERKLGYTFEKQGRLLATALTHRSYAGGGDSYERLEYLGDAILDFWSTSRLHPLTSTPRNLTYKRALLVSNGVLALLSIRVLGLHKAVLHSSAPLEEAMRVASEKADEFGWRDVVEGGLTWLWQPPKVLGDVLEAVLAAIFIDSGLKLDPVFAVLDKLYEEIMPLLEQGEVRDPFSRFLMFRDSHGCQDMYIKLTRVDPSDPSTGPPSGEPPSSTFPSASHALPHSPNEPYYLATPFFHPSCSTSSPSALTNTTTATLTPLVPPTRSTSKQVAKQLAAKSALEVLEVLEAQAVKEGRDVCECRARAREEGQRRRREKEREEEEGEGEGDEEDGTPEGAGSEKEEGQGEGEAALGAGREGEAREGEEEEAEETENGVEVEPPSRVREY